MTEPPPPKWLKLFLWATIPGLSLLSIIGLVLGRQQAQLPVELAPVASTPIAGSPAGGVASPGPTHPSPRPSSKASPVPVNPATLSAQEKAINHQSKAAFLASSATVDSLVEMHVAIAEGLPSLTIGSPTGAILMDQKGKRLQRLANGGSYSLQAEGNSIRFGDALVPAMVVLDPGIGKLFQLNGRTYRGRLIIAADGGRLWGVNYVSLRQYLHSVVGSEVSPSWPAEALKAQAVAARSYALTYYFRPMNSLFHLGATEYYQVYKGTETEAASTKKAVDVTAGEFVSYRGGIVESLYAASDDIVAEAFQGKGMSQLGALSLAEGGYSYKQILANYYPGTGVARVEEDIE